MSFREFHRYIASQRELSLKIPQFWDVKKFFQPKRFLDYLGAGTRNHSKRSSRDARNVQLKVSESGVIKGSNQRQFVQKGNPNKNLYQQKERMIRDRRNGPADHLYKIGVENPIEYVNLVLFAPSDRIRLFVVTD